MKTTKVKLPDNRGITLIEAIVSSLLLVIGTLVLSTGFVASARMMKISTDDKKSAQMVTAVVNGGSRGNTEDSGHEDWPVIFRIDGIEFKGYAKMKQFSDRQNKNIAFYMLD